MSIRAAASRAWSRVSATTMATISPTWRTLPMAIAGCAGSTMGDPSLLWISHPVGMPPTSAMSGPVNTARTPGADSAAPVSTLPRSAWATGERSRCANNWPGRLMSSV